MKVVTKYPIVTSNSDAQTESYYRGTYSAAEGELPLYGEMEVITNYPIIRTNSNAQSKDVYRSTYSAAFGDGWLTSAAGRERRRKRREARQSKKAENQRTGNTFGNKIGKFAQSDLGKGLLGKVIGGGGDAMGESVDTGLPMAELPPEGMSTGMKIGLIVGGVAILGVAAYFLLGKKSGKAGASAKPTA